FPDDKPAASVRLTVTDGLGNRASEDHPIHLRNAQPVVNAVNVEALAGAPATTVCRFADAGIGAFDESGLIAGQEEMHWLGGPADVVSSGAEWSPSFSSGFFEFRVDGSGTCTVQ